MCELKFRGRRLDNKDWVHGDLITETNGNLELKRTFIHLRISQVNFTQNALSSTLCLYEVIPETVGQFTDLLDRNGREIYEGDVVEREGQTVVVIFEDGAFWVGGTILLHANFPEKVEVIGNIHDNSELVGDGLAKPT